MRLASLRSRRTAALLSGLAVITTVLVVPVRTVEASGSLGLTVPASVTTTYNTNHAVSSITLSNGGFSAIQEQMSVTHGTLSMSTTTGLTFVSGQGNGTANVQFTGSPTDVQTALDTLSYTPASGYTGSDAVTYQTSPGGGLFNPDNNHFYEFVDNGSNITWTAAKTAADSRTFAGMTGYLATVTTAAEQAFVQTKLQGQGWFAASDAASEGHWIWADGPESGTEFWQGTRAGAGCAFLTCAAVSGRYNNWASGEPNDSGGNEDYAHFLNGGQWNDYPNSLNIQKYLVEYGGMGGDPVVTDTQTTSITVNATTPGAPTSLSATAGDAQLSVSWSAPVSNGGTSIDAYNVEYSATGGAPWATASSSATSPYIINGLTNGVSVTVHVSAHNSVGWGTMATPVTATPITTATAPENLVLAAGNAQIAASWDASSDNGGSTITGYRVEYSPNGSSWTTASASTSSPYTITGLTNGTTYMVRIKALNGAGAGTAAIVSAMAGTTPGAVRTLTATSADRSTEVSWTAPLSNGGLAITGYTVEYSADGSNWSTASSSATSPYTVTGVTNGITYSVRVTARNTRGDGPSTTVTVTPLGIPSAPSDVHVAKTPVAATISWNAPVDDGGTPVTSYTLEYRVAGGSWSTVSTSATSPTVIEHLTPGTAYEARLIANNSVGSSTAASTSFTTDPPPAPALPIPVQVGNDGTVTSVPSFDTGDDNQIIASTPSGDGSWSLTSDGGVFTAGDAPFFGSMGGAPLSAPAVGLSPTSSGDGYFIVGSDGGVFAFGDAPFYGSLAGEDLNAPVTALASTCSGDGYYLVGADGGVFSFGDAGFYGSMSGQRLNGPMTGIVDACGGHGYWTFAADGGVFAFGDAPFYGSLAGHTPAGGIVAMQSAPDGRGYWLIGADGTTYGFGSVAP